VRRKNKTLKKIEYILKENEVKYKEIQFKERNNVLNLMDDVINSLKRPEFYYMGNKKKELERMFDKSYVYNLGAYYKDILIGMTQLYIDQEDLESYINISDLKMKPQKTDRFLKQDGLF